jgi:serine/threonine-protein kinase
MLNRPTRRPTADASREDGLARSGRIGVPFMENTHLDPNRPPKPPSDPGSDLRRLGTYQILRKLGEGGMGSVYLGYNEGEARQVAIKVLGDPLTANQAFVDRFYREAKSGALLNHPNIVRTLSVGQDKATGRHYLILEFVDGTSASELLQERGAMSVGDAVHIALDIARGLEHAHSRNVVHRDIKPDNILLARTGIAKLSDLGLAKRLDEASHLTATRQGFGTTAYMPYEQAMNARRADGRSDIYALGATLYHLVTGKVPFPGDNHVDVVDKKRIGEFTPAGELNAAVPRMLDEILARMLARDPQDRYQTVSELIVDLERTRLAARVPEYADPERALQDPVVRARLAKPAHPTQPDLDSRRVTPANGEPAADVVGELWVVRFAHRSGKLARVRMKTDEVIERLRVGRLSGEAEARPAGEGPFRPIRSFPPFKDVPIGKRRQRRAGKRPVRDEGRAWLWPAGIGLGAMLLAFLLYLLLR